MKVWHFIASLWTEVKPKAIGSMGFTFYRGLADRNCSINECISVVHVMHI